jgi:osmotically-inducible protein OsmY
MLTVLVWLGEHIITNQAAVTPPGVEGKAKRVNPDLRAGIEKNLFAALITNGPQKAVKSDVKNAVVTLSGKVNSKTQCARPEKVVCSVLNLKQVANELEIKNRKATSLK